MANALALFDPGNVPAHVKKFIEEHAGNIPVSDNIPQLSIKGKVFSIVLGGEATKIMKVNAEGEEEPVNILPVVILGAADRRGRNHYADGYDSDKKSAPDCWSNDGIAPDETVKHKKSSKCAKCPLSVKGSRTSESGKAGVACQEFRMLAVVPAHDLAFEPLRLKLPVTSDWDGQNKAAQDKGWYGFKNYTDMLRGKSVTHMSVLSTKLKFDAGAEYPKVQFSPGKWLSDEQLETVAELTASDKVKDLMVVSYRPAAEDEPDTAKMPEDEDDVVLPKGKAATPASGKTKAAPAVVDDEDDAGTADATDEAAAEDDDEVVPPPKTTAKAAAVAPKAVVKAKAAPAVVDDEDDEDAQIAAAIKAKNAKKAAAAATQAEAAPKAKAKAAVVEEDEDDAPVATPSVKKAAATTSAKPVQVSKAVAGLVGKWADDD